MESLPPGKVVFPWEGCSALKTPFVALYLESRFLANSLSKPQFCPRDIRVSRGYPEGSPERRFERFWMSLTFTLPRGNSSPRETFPGDQLLDSGHRHGSPMMIDASIGYMVPWLQREPSHEDDGGGRESHRFPPPTTFSSPGESSLQHQWGFTMAS